MNADRFKKSAVKFSLILIFSSFALSAVGQNKFGFTGNLGVFFAESPVQGKTKPGLDVSFGALISIYKEKLYIKPTPNLRMVEFKTAGMRESYLLIGLGIEVLARFGDYEKAQVYPFGKVAFTHMAMSLTNGLNSSNTKNQNILSGNAPTFGFGVIGEVKNFQLKLQYEIVQAELDYADDVTADQKAIYDNRFPFNNTSITVGYTFNRR